ncbi:MAG: barstar family protein [Proteobacteria bacterium]|nr:barstar family protein [Pseudomonadota bacterium]
MKTARLDSSHDTMAKVYATLAADLAFPAHFSANLDALWDVLLRDVPGPFEIVWPGATKAGAKIGPKFKALLTLLGELEEARGDFRFRRR